VQPFCNSLPSPSDTRTAIFVGTVTDVYPADSIREYKEALLANVPQSVSFMDQLKGGWIRLWRGVLLPEEEQKIMSAKSPFDLAAPLKGMSWSLPRRVRFDVLEQFKGATDGRFELFTGIGGGDCGVEFHKGEVFLVVARLNTFTRRWTTSICSRTAHIRYADADLTLLRAWKKGEPFPCPSSPLARQNQGLELWVSVKEQLTKSGADYFEAGMKGALMPQFRGIVLSSSPASRPEVLVLSISGEGPEATLKLDRPLEHPIHPGTKVDFEGVAIEFLQNPFMVTFEVTAKRLTLNPSGPPKDIAP